MLKVSKLGFGCSGLTGIYNDPVPEEDAFSLIKHAFDRGITFFDTADAYGNNANELLVGKVNINHYFPLNLEFNKFNF